MRTSIMLGIVLVALGIVVLVTGLTYPDSKTIVDLGDLKARVTEHKTVPDWAGVAAIAGGVLLIAAGATSRRRSS